MLLAWDNVITDAAPLTVGSEITTLPGINVQTQHLSQKWHTAAGVKASYLVYDMGASVNRKVLSVLGTNLTPAATVRLRTSNADPAVLGAVIDDSTLLPGGVKAGYGSIHKMFNFNGRYWRVDLADATVPDNLQTGRVAIMPTWERDDSLTFPWSVTTVDPSTIDESSGGQEYAEVKQQYRQLEFTLDYLSQAEIMDNLFAMARASGVVKDVLAIPFKNGAYVSEQAVWGRCLASEPVVHYRTSIFRQKFTVKERL